MTLNFDLKFHDKIIKNIPDDLDISSDLKNELNDLVERNEEYNFNNYLRYTNIFVKYIPTFFNFEYNEKYSFDKYSWVKEILDILDNEKSFEELEKIAFENDNKIMDKFEEAFHKELKKKGLM